MTSVAPPPSTSMKYIWRAGAALAEAWPKVSRHARTATDNRLCDTFPPTTANTSANCSRRCGHSLQNVPVALGDGGLSLFQETGGLGSLRLPVHPARHILLEEKTGPAVVAVGEKHEAV